MNSNGFIRLQVSDSKISVENTYSKNTTVVCWTKQLLTLKSRGTSENNA